MKKLIFVLAFLVTASAVYSQQEPLRSNYRFNTMLINPAATGSSGMWNVKAGYRNQWVTLPGAPVTMSLSVDAMPFNRMGIGLAAFQDVIGPAKSYGLQLSYAYHIPVGMGHLGIGLAGRAYRYSLDWDLVHTQDLYDPAIFDALPESMISDLNLGVYYHTESLYAGISVPQMIQLSNEEAIVLERNIYALAGYKWAIGSDFTLEPGAILRYNFSSGVPMNYDVSLRTWLLEEQLMFGIGYRAGGFITFMTGFSVQDKYQFGYAYDYATNSDLKTHSLGSHELRFGYSFGKNKLQTSE